MQNVVKLLTVSCAWHNKHNIVRKSILFVVPSSLQILYDKLLVTLLIYKQINKIAVGTVMVYINNLEAYARQTRTLDSTEH